MKTKLVGRWILTPLIVSALAFPAMPTAEAAGAQAGSPCKTPNAVVKSGGKYLTCEVMQDLQKFWVVGDQYPPTTPFGNANLKASIKAFPRAQRSSCVPGPGQEYQFFRTDTTLVIEPGNSNHLLVGVERLGLFESFDAGQSWKPMSTKGILFDMKKPDNTVCLKEPWGMQWDPNVKGRVYFLFGGGGTVNAGKWQARGAGLYVSNDSGKTWEFLTKPNMNAYTANFTIDPNDSNILYLGTVSMPLSSNPTPSAKDDVFVKSGIIYKSTDAGKNWVELKTGWGKKTRSSFLFINKNNSNEMIWGVFKDRTAFDENVKAPPGTGLQSGLYRSLNGGAGFQFAGDTAVHKYTPIRNLSAASPDLQYLIIGNQEPNVDNRSFYSTDAGKTFNLIENINQVELPVFVPGTKSSFLALEQKYNNETRDRVLRTDDGGKTWTEIGRLPIEIQLRDGQGPTDGNSRPSNLLFDPNNPLTVYVNAASGKIARSLDQGKSWTLLTTKELFPKWVVKSQ